MFEGRPRAFPKVCFGWLLSDEYLDWMLNQSHELSNARAKT